MKKQTIPQWLFEKGILLSKSVGRRMVVQAHLTLDDKKVSTSDEFTETELYRIKLADGRNLIQVLVD